MLHLFDVHRMQGKLNYHTRESSSIDRTCFLVYICHSHMTFSHLYFMRTIEDEMNESPCVSLEYI